MAANDYNSLNKLRKPLILLLVVFSCQLIKTQNINYASYNLNNRVCTKGQLQSPIDLNTMDSSFNTTISYVYDDYKTINKAVCQFRGKLIEVSSLDAFLQQKPDDFGSIIVDQQGILSKFNLQKIVLHTPSEHSIDNKLVDMEIQFIHTKDITFNPTVNQFRKMFDTNTVLTISVLFSRKASISDNGFVDSLRTNFVDKNAQTLSTSFNMTNIPSQFIKYKQFYYYQGSSTSAPCNENSNYYVISELFTLSQANYDFFVNKYKSFYTNAQNTKGISHLNGRKLFRNFMTAKEAGSFNLYSSFGTLLIILTAVLL